MTEQKTKIIWSEILLGQYLLFGLLGKLLYSNPDDTLLQAAIKDDPFDEAPFANANPSVIEGLNLLRKWSEECKQSENQKELLTDVQVDYMRLFAITERLPLAPWESFYGNDERLLFQESMLDVRNWYARFGLELVNAGHEPDDHIGLELLFVAHLAQLGLAALEAGNDLEFEQALAAQRGFLSKHLLLWAPLWCEQMLEYARTDFYRGLALVIRGALIELAATLNIEIPEAARS